LRYFFILSSNIVACLNLNHAWKSLIFCHKFQYINIKPMLAGINAKLTRAGRLKGVLAYTRNEAMPKHVAYSSWSNVRLKTIFSLYCNDCGIS
jgi:hypothetical protein